MNLSEWGLRLQPSNVSVELVLEFYGRCRGHLSLRQGRGNIKCTSIYKCTLNDIKTTVKNLSVCTLMSIPNSWFPKSVYGQTNLKQVYMATMQVNFKVVCFTICIDAYSKWGEIIPMKSTNSQCTIQAVRSIFALWEPTILVISDNGP